MRSNDASALVQAGLRNKTGILATATQYSGTYYATVIQTDASTAGQNPAPIPPGNMTITIPQLSGQKVWGPLPYPGSVAPPLGTKTTITFDPNNVPVVHSHVNWSPNVTPVGSVIDFAGSSAPSGWLLCDGSSYGTSTYPDLYSAIGYTWGGSGSTFKVPDLRGRVTLGAGSGSGLTSRTLGANGGAETYSFTIASTNIPAHTHTVTTGTETAHTHVATPTDPGHQHTIAGSSYSTVSNTVSVSGTSASGAASLGIESAAHTHPDAGHYHGMSPASNGLPATITAYMYADSSGDVLSGTGGSVKMSRQYSTGEGNASIGSPSVTHSHTDSGHTHSISASGTIPSLSIQGTGTSSKVTTSLTVSNSSVSTGWGNQTYTSSSAYQATPSAIVVNTVPPFAVLNKIIKSTK